MLDRTTARRLIRDWQATDKQVVFTNGCFDVLHAGHVELLSSARALGDVLVVGLNSDASVRRLKGAGRPIQAAADRGRILEALRSVDLVVMFEEDTPEELIRALLPDILVKGADYRPEEIAGAAFIRERGGRVVTIELTPGQSTSAIIARILDEPHG
ncbi:MAG: D-glycero-beta-D-manno-heptose 1-phosphate adenylyltransferase [Candidatus Neomarinimicrobiota bacterium]